MARTLDIEPIDASFGAVVTGLSLAMLDNEAWGKPRDRQRYPGPHRDSAEVHLLWLLSGAATFDLIPYCRAHPRPAGVRRTPLQVPADGNSRGLKSANTAGGSCDAVAIARPQWTRLGSWRP